MKDAPVNERIKQVRQALNLSQMTFSRGIHLSNGHFADIELGNQKANDRIITLIAAKYGVSRRWLESGEGEMFDDKPDEQLQQMLITFRELNPDFRDFVLHFIDRLLKLQNRKGKEGEG